MPGRRRIASISRKDHASGPANISSKPLHKATDPFTALQDSPEPLYAVDRDGRIVVCTAAFAALVGERREHLVGRLSLLLYPAEFAPVLLMRRLQGFLGRDVPETLDAKIRRSDGTTIPVEISARNVRRGMETIGRAIVVRPLPAEAAAPAATQARVESLVHLSDEEADALPYGLVMLDAQGVVIGYNDAEARLSGHARNRFVGRNFFADIAHHTHMRGVAGLYRQMVETGEPPTAQLDLVFRLPRGERHVSMLMAYFPVMGQGMILVDPRAPESR